jgi:hypothetical protein
MQMLDCFVARAPRNDALTHTSTFSRQTFTRAVHCRVPRKTEGAGNARRSTHPQPRVRKKSTRDSHHRSTATIRHSLREWFYGLLRALPGDRAFLPPSPARCESIVATLTPASGRRNHTTSPSAKPRRSSVRRARVHRIPRPTSVTIAIRPSLRVRDGAGCKFDLGKAKAENFFDQDWTGRIALMSRAIFVFGACARVPDAGSGA